MSTAHEGVGIVMPDDHGLFHDGLRNIPQTESSIRIVGEASDGDAVLKTIASVTPDILLLDVEMGRTHVTTTVSAVRQAAPRCGVIVLTMHDDAELLGELLAIGIRGYLPKSIGWRELVSAVMSVSADPGRVVLSVSPSTVTRANSPHSGTLSKRGLDILRLTAQAMSNSQIGSRLSITEATVKHHPHNVFRKLDAGITPGCGQQGPLHEADRGIRA